MTCYQRHLGWLFEAVDTTYDKDGRAQVHRAVTALVELPESAHCPEIWAALKQRYGIDTRVQSERLAEDLARQLEAGGE